MGAPRSTPRSEEFIRVVAVFLAIAWLAVGLRMYVRVRIIKAFGWDDGWILLAQAMHTANAFAAMMGAVYGSGRRSQDLTPENMMKALRCWWICYFTYCFTMICAKVSVGLFLLRLMTTAQRILKLVINSVVAVSVVVGLLFAFITMLQCSPVPYFWTRALGASGKCLDMNVIMILTYVVSAVFATCDFAFAILPVFMIKDLNMTKRTKLLLIPILGMACVASSAVLARLAYVPAFRDPDFLYATVPIAIWSEIEISLAITASSLSTLRPLHRVCAERFSWWPSLSTEAKSARKGYGSSKTSAAVRSSRSKGIELNSLDLEKDEHAQSEGGFVLGDLSFKQDAENPGITRFTSVQVSYAECKEKA